jgi:hypothetical protein
MEKWKWGNSIWVSKTVGNVSHNDYPALRLLGGATNSKILIQIDEAVYFIRDFFQLTNQLEPFVMLSKD